MFAIGDSEWPGLSKLVEECGEVTQVVGKLMGTGGNLNHWDGSKLDVRLMEEMADVLAAIRFVVRHCNVDADALNTRADRKLRQFEDWHATDQKGST